MLVHDARKKAAPKAAETGNSPPKLFTAGDMGFSVEYLANI